MIVIKYSTTKNIVVGTIFIKNIHTPYVVVKMLCTRDVCDDSKALVAMVRSRGMEEYNRCQ
jgi:hypothetical protein